MSWSLGEPCGKFLSVDVTVISVCDTDWRKGRLGDPCGKFMSIDMAVNSVCDTDWRKGRLGVLEILVVNSCL